MGCQVGWLQAWSFLAADVFIHTFIFSRQVVKVDDGRAAEGVDFTPEVELEFHLSDDVLNLSL